MLVLGRQRSPASIRSRGLRARLAVVVVASLAALGSAVAAEAKVEPRAIVVVPFDASSLAPDDQWMGEAVAQAISLGLVQQPALVQIERARLRAVVDPGVWTEAHVSQAGQAVHADAALYGSVGRKGSDLLLEPRLMDLKSRQTKALPPTTFTDTDLPTQLASLSAVYARTLHPALSDGERARVERAARPTSSLIALELFARGQMAFYDGANESALDLLLRAAEADSSFAIAGYALGVVHLALGNRWKAAAQFRAASLLDSRMPEPFKAFGDLFLTNPRALIDQAIEAYSAAIERRAFYADAYAGLGDAHVAKGDIDAALAAYQRAATFDPFKPSTHLRLGRSYTNKGLCSDAQTAYTRARELDPRAAVAPGPCGSP